jgi:tyrosyl-tRNA synthetase
VIVLGTFTGEIGDPSGNLTARPRYSRETLSASALILEHQINVVLADYIGADRGQVEIKRNDDWVSHMDMSQLLRWGYDIDQSLLLDRPDFEKRRQNKRPLSLSEMLYGLFQAHDTLVTNPDVELAGVDQLHNGMLMRNIFRLEQKQPPFLMLLPLLPGTNGEPKMSSFSKNDVSITMSREVIRDRLQAMTSLNDITQYFRLLTDEDEEQLNSNRESVEKNKGLILSDLQSLLAEAVLDKLPEGLENLHERTDLRRF